MSEIPQRQTPGLPSGALEEARSLIGVELRRHDHRWNTEAHPDTVRHFCWGIGDDNPLFCDPAHGARTRWGAGIAPGCFLYTVDSTVVAPKLRGIQWLYGGTRWEWYRPVRHRERLTTRVRLLDAVEKSGRNARSFIVQTGESAFFAKDGTLVAQAYGSTARTPRARSEGGLRYAPREAHRYTADEIEAIGRAVQEEVVRGVVPRDWDEVREGDILRPVVKGPLNVTDMICWYSGAGHTYQAHERAERHRRRHPADAFVNPATGAPDSAARGHAEQAMAREVGMPGGYDVGPQRISWLGHLLTNWAGDDGFVRVLDVKLRRPNIFGDTSWCRGRVLDKRIEDGAALVDVAVWVENQLGETTADGTAVVELPRRGTAAP
jgi:acyl dehydratase